MNNAVLQQSAKPEYGIPTGPKPLFPEYDMDTGKHRWRLCCLEKEASDSCVLPAMQEL